MKFTVILLISTLQSCASLTREECNRTNWMIKGEQDASSAVKISRFQNYKQECQEQGVNLSEAKYIEGYDKGLKKFCTYSAGYLHGQKGSSPFPECDKTGHSFRRGYDEGLQQFKGAERREAIKRILRSYNSQRCSSGFDCRKEGDCSFNKCRHDDTKCTFDSDCKVEGSCSKESEYVSSINEWVSADVCKY